VRRVLPSGAGASFNPAFGERLGKLHDDRNHVNIDARRNLHDHNYRHVRRVLTHTTTVSLTVNAALPSRNFSLVEITQQRDDCFREAVLGPAQLPFTPSNGLFPAA